MKIAVLYAYAQNSKKTLVEAVSKALSDGISSNGYDVDVFDMFPSVGYVKLSFYDYVVIISQPMSFFSKAIPSVVFSFLSSAGVVSGKKCSCFITSFSLRKQKVLHSLMNALESEGMFIRVSDYISGVNSAYVIGKHLKVD